MSRLKHFPRVYLPPKCPTCGEKLLRWSWFENPKEMVVYWYCLECDKRGIEPCIHAMDKRKMLAVRNIRCVSGFGKYSYHRDYVFIWTGGCFKAYTTLKSFLKDQARLEKANAPNS